MRKEFASLFTLGGRVSRSSYFLWGVSLFLVKYAIDWLVATQVMGRAWSPLRYLIWPDGQALLIFNLPVADQRFAMVMLVIALPFICLGVSLTLKRLRDAEMPGWLIILFFVPMVNLLLIVWLCLVPSHLQATLAERTTNSEKAKPSQFSSTGQSSVVAFWWACIISTVLSAVLAVLASIVLRSYGFGIFVLLPFANGWLAAILYALPAERTLTQCLGVGLASLFLSAVILLLFAIEGLLCLLMFAPMALAIGLLGATVGYAMQWRLWQQNSRPAMILALVVLVPTLMAAEAYEGLIPSLCNVQTVVIVHAPVETVWRYVTAFPPLPEPSNWMFRLGIAYPVRAEIVGTGVGAIRYCVFSTGPFVEPITAWEAPYRLAFDVTGQPCPMVELSPFRLHPPHLDNFLISRRGEFRLESLPDGSTRLIGTTWYTNKMWPELYWRLWSDHLIGQIHQRVLEHVKQCAESENTLK